MIDEDLMKVLLYGNKHNLRYRAEIKTEKNLSLWINIKLLSFLNAVAFYFTTVPLL